MTAGFWRLVRALAPPWRHHSHYASFLLLLVVDMSLLWFQNVMESLTLDCNAVFKFQVSNHIFKKKLYYYYNTVHQAHEDDVGYCL